VQSSRFARIEDIWSWLPAFRAVAETQSIRAAAQLLHVAPSAVSRTLRLLETSLDRQLFHRSHKRLRLNPRGERLLRSVRDAMRGVDDGLADVLARSIGEVRIATPDTLAATHVIPVLARFLAAEPSLRIRLEPAQGELVAKLLRGELDLVCTTRPVTNAAFTVTRLADLTSSVYCGDAHPLRRKRRVTHAEVVAHGFVAPPHAADGTTVEGWPTNIERTVTTIVHSLQQGLDLCRIGAALAVFPDLLARGLHRVPIDIAEPARVYVITRRPLGHHSIIESLARALGARP
jgi:DNA-binding transcriptional LysR family regulator